MKPRQIHYSFDRLSIRSDLSEPLMRALVPLGYETPTPIQAQAIPHVLAWT